MGRLLLRILVVALWVSLSGGAASASQIVDEVRALLDSLRSQHQAPGLAGEATDHIHPAPQPICKDFSNGSHWEWLTHQECQDRALPCRTSNMQYKTLSDQGTEVHDKMVLSMGDGCVFRHVDRGMLGAPCGQGPVTNLSILVIGDSVARGHFVSLCNILGTSPRSLQGHPLSEDNKHDFFYCSSNSLTIYFMFLRGVYKKAYMTEKMHQQLRKKHPNMIIKNLSKRNNEISALDMFQKMTSGAWSPFGSHFDIRNADMIFWASGIWDVTNKQDLREYGYNLRLIFKTLASLQGKVYVRGITQLHRKYEGTKDITETFWAWKNIMKLGPMYDKATRTIAEDMGFDFLDVAKLNRADETRDGIHFDKVQTSPILVTGECNRAIGDIFANLIHDMQVGMCG